jgi:SPP1 gp7 family putative phage head morphogenesis protein
MPSAIENAIATYRTRLLAGDKKARDATFTAYNQIRQTLIDRLDDLVAVVAANGELSGTDVLNLDRVVSLLDDIEAAIDALSGPWGRFIEAAQRQAVQLAFETTFGLVVVQRASLAASFNRINIGAVQSMVGRLGDGSPLRTYLDNLGPQTSQAIREALIDGIGRGINPVQLANDLVRTVDVAGWKLAQTTRTAMLNSYREASLQTYQQNKDILNGWVWLASLSSRTCSSCLANHGREFPMSTQFFASHPSCRCSPAPRVKGVDFPLTESGAEWFDRQPQTTQDAVLGRNGGELYRDGAVELGDFQVLRRDSIWGDAYQRTGATTAMANAERRERRAA